MMLQLIPAGDSAMLIKLGNDISPDTNLKVRQLQFTLIQMQVNGILELVPAYNELMVYYSPGIIDYKEISSLIRKAATEQKNLRLPQQWLIFIPVVYGGSDGPDLSDVARHNGITEEEVIQIHCGTDYPVYMLGFMPGFCYLGGMDSRIACPRRETPRQMVAAGSVGIAGHQTGIYPLASPGGWQIIGRTPLPLFNPEVADPFLVSAGDTIRFYPIDQTEAESISSAISKGFFKPRKELQP